jgi:glutaredoxin
MKPPRVTLYTSRQCSACRQARAYLEQLGIPFQELDVRTSQRAQKSLARLGTRSLPVILVGDRAVQGFDRKRLDTLLKQA